MALSELSLVHIYELPDRLFLHPLTLTEAGFWLAVSPARRLNRDASTDMLGSAVRELGEPRDERVPMPERDDYPTVLQPIFAVAGVANWQRLEQDARLCEVARKATELVVIPNEIGGSHDVGAGFHRLDELARRLPLTTTSAELGEAVLAGLTQARQRTREGAA